MNYRMDLSYDGTKYRGWQRLKQQGSIQGKVEETLSKYFEKDIKITGASRTDAGVHAKMQVCNFKLNREIDTETVRRELNSYLPKDIIITSIKKIGDRFHSRFNAKKKTYTYTIWRNDAPYPPLFERKYVYSFDQRMDIDKLKKAAKKFLGEHDFKGFSSDKTKKSTVRNIESIDIADDEFSVKITITGDGFLHNMIRIIVGTMIEISTGDMDIKVIDKVFKSKDRELAGFTVPAQGLILEKIYY